MKNEMAELPLKLKAIPGTPTELANNNFWTRGRFGNFSFFGFRTVTLVRNIILYNSGRVKANTF